MKSHLLKKIILISVIVLSLMIPFTAYASEKTDPTKIPGSTMTLCPDCDGLGICPDCPDSKETCIECNNTNICPTCNGSGYVESPSRFYNSIFSLFPPVLAIILALITKEVYSSLFIGILAGGLLYSNFNPVNTVQHILDDGMISVLSDSYNVGILIFLIILGSIVCLMNKSGGSAAFGRWAETHIKSRAGAQLATVFLGCLIFIDDYFNCLTVGSVMRPVTDKHKISRAKLAYLIDSTAAPICIIAPISSWAAAVAAFAEEGEGLNLFIKAIPFNFYALTTIVMLVVLITTKTEYGKMSTFERNAMEGDLFSGHNPYASMDKDKVSDNGKVKDLIIPIAVLIVCCVAGMIFTGNFFDPSSSNYLNFIKAFADSDASTGLSSGSLIALIFSMIYFYFRKTVHFNDIMESIPEGFKAMVPAIMILTFAWTLKAMTDSLGATVFVRDFVRSQAAGMQLLLPAIVFLIGCLLAFATGTSWGNIWNAHSYCSKCIYNG